MKYKGITLKMQNKYILEDIIEVLYYGNQGTDTNTSLKIAIIRQVALIRLLLDKTMISEEKLRNYTEVITKEFIGKGALNEIRIIEKQGKA